ncbi:hypothetical protein Hdeb2414_s0003g00091241 [Helianthus debilis subsp. tardiflorus]
MHNDDQNPSTKSSNSIKKKTIQNEKVLDYVRRICLFVNMMRLRSSLDDDFETPPSKRFTRETEKKEGTSKNKATSASVNVNMPRIRNSLDDDFETPPPKRFKPTTTKKGGTSETKASSAFVHYKKKRIRIRNPPLTFCELLEGLTAEQEHSIDAIGFASIKSFNIKSLPSRLGYWLLSNYNPSDNILNLGSHTIKITRELVHQTLGIPMGKVHLTEKKKPSRKDPVVAEFRRQFDSSLPFKKIPIVRDVLDKVKSSKNSGRLFKLNFLLLFNTIIGEMCQGSTVNRKFLTSLKEGTDIKSMDWCAYIITCLDRTKRKWNGKQHYNGPLTFLMMLYAHDTYKRSNRKEKGIPISYIKDQNLRQLDESKRKELIKGSLKEQKQEPALEILPLSSIKPTCTKNLKLKIKLRKKKKLRWD